MWLNWLFLDLNSTFKHPPAHTPCVYCHGPSARWDGDVVSRPLAAIGCGLCVKKKVCWRHLFPRKKKKRRTPSPPHPPYPVWETDLGSVLRLPLAGSLYKIQLEPLHSQHTNTSQRRAVSSITPPLSHRFETGCRGSTYNFYAFLFALLLCRWRRPLKKTTEEDHCSAHWVLF